MIRPKVILGLTSSNLSSNNFLFKILTKVFFSGLWVEHANCLTTHVPLVHALMGLNVTQPLRSGSPATSSNASACWAIQDSSARRTSMTAMALRAQEIMNVLTK